MPSLRWQIWRRGWSKWNVRLKPRPGAKSSRCFWTFAIEWSGEWRRKMLDWESRRETARETAVALEKGYALSLDRLDEVLHQLEVTEIPCQGRPFDPRYMQAVDLEETNQVPEGTVVEVYRVGYE